jgi:hypothetical protein
MQLYFVSIGISSSRTELIPASGRGGNILWHENAFKRQWLEMCLSSSFLGRKKGGGDRKQSLYLLLPVSSFVK